MFILITCGKYLISSLFDFGIVRVFSSFSVGNIIPSEYAQHTFPFVLQVLLQPSRLLFVRISLSIVSLSYGLSFVSTLEI